MPPSAANRSTRNRLRCLTLLLALGGLPAAAQEAPPAASPPSHTGFAVGARMGYGFPFGDSRQGFALDQVLEGVVAPQVELSWFFTPHFALDLQGQYGLARYPLTCGDETCRGGVLRLGVGVSYHFFSTGAWSHWVGAGVGYERQTTRQEVVGGKASSTQWGLELLNLQGGVDYALSENVRVGPCLTGAMGMYLQQRSVFNGQEGGSESIDDRAIHFWVQPGIRLQLRL